MPAPKAFYDMVWLRPWLAHWHDPKWHFAACWACDLMIWRRRKGQLHHFVRKHSACGHFDSDHLSRVHGLACPEMGAARSSSGRV